MLPTYTPAEHCILIVDDDRAIGESLQQALSEETRYRVLWIAEADLALLSASYVRPVFIVLDYRMPLMDGLALYDHLQEVEATHGVPVVMISAFQALPYAQLEQRGIHLLKKPFNLLALLRIIRKVTGEDEQSAAEEPSGNSR